MSNNKPKNPVCAIWWYDAAYMFQEELPQEEMPQPTLTVGFIVESNDEFTHVATNVAYIEETGEIAPKEGVFIPDGAIIRFKKIGFLHEQE